MYIVISLLADPLNYAIPCYFSFFLTISTSLHFTSVYRYYWDSLYFYRDSISLYRPGTCLCKPGCPLKTQICLPLPLGAGVKGGHHHCKAALLLLPLRSSLEASGLELDPWLEIEGTVPWAETPWMWSSLVLWGALVHRKDWSLNGEWTCTPLVYLLRGALHLWISTVNLSCCSGKNVRLTLLK